MKKTIFAAAVASIAALAAQASEVNLISLAVTNIVETTYSDDNGSVVTNIPSVVFGTGGFNSYNQWGVCWWDNRKDCAFDGFGWYDNNGTTEAQGHVEFDSEEAIWTGYQVSAAAVVSRIRFLSTPDPESDNGWVRAERTLGCSFQAANSADFSDAVTLYTVGEGGETKYSLTNGWQEVPVSSAQSFTYLRFYAPEGKKGGSIAEVEFYGQTWAEATSGTPSAAPQNLTISSVDADTDAVTLTWDAPTEPCRSAKVIRSTAPGGSTFDVTLETLSATTLTYTDSDAARIPGVTYYYRVAFANEDNVGPVSEAVSHRHVVQLERTSLSDTSLKNGMSAIFYDWDNSTGALAFDGNVATFADINANDGYKENIKIGVDLGAAYVIDTFKIYPRSDGYLYRLNGVVLGASNDSSDWKNGTAISAACAISDAAWYAFETTDKRPYRYVYVMKPNDDDFYGNVAELALYGYTLASSQSVLLAPENAAAEWRGSKAVIAWTASPNAASYQVERKADGGDWTVVAQGLAEQQYVDRPERPTKVGYIYRVASVDGNGGLAYTVSVTPTGTPSPSGMAIILR